MGFFSGLLKAVAFVGGIVAAPFTAGASLLLTAGVIGLNNKENQDARNAAALKLLNQGSSIGANLGSVILAPKKNNPPPINYKGEIPTYTERIVTPIEKMDVSLYGNYSDINVLTIPVDNDESNFQVVPNTFFPYIVTFTNHPPSNGIRYISQFVYDKISSDWETNLGKVCYTLEPTLSPYPYINFDWQTFVDKFNNIEADKLKKDGGILFGFTISPIFLLQWMDGPEATNMLDYTWYIPPSPKTVKEPNPVDNSGPADRVKGAISTDPKRADRMQQLLDVASKAALGYGVAKAALGGIASIYGNTKSAVKNLQDTAKNVGDKLAMLKVALSKDAINGKISQVKNLIKTKLPTPKNIKAMVINIRGEIMAAVNPIQLKIKKLIKRTPKDKSKNKKFSFKDFNMPDFPEVPNLPNIPTLPKQLNLGTINQLPGLGGLPNIVGLASSAKGIVSGIGNMNFKDPMTLLNAPANILNQVSSFGNAVAVEAAKPYDSAAKAAQLGREADMKKFEQFQTDMKKQLLETLSSQRISLPNPIKTTYIAEVKTPSPNVNILNNYFNGKSDSYSSGS
jgi:hypothetical protein